MNIAEFEKKYYLHDSAIENILFDPEDKKLTLNIEFCFWLQKWYKSDELANGLIEVIFENVSLFEYEHHDFIEILENLDTEIDHTEIDYNNVLSIFVREYDTQRQPDEIFWWIKIKADNITVKEIERYNL